MTQLLEALAAGLGIGVLIGWNMRTVLDSTADSALMVQVAESLESF